MHIDKFPMVMLPVHCPSCGSPEVIKAGRQPNGAQRYRCQNAECRRTMFQLHYCDHGRLPAVEIVSRYTSLADIERSFRVLRNLISGRDETYSQQ